MKRQQFQATYLNFQVLESFMHWKHAYVFQTEDDQLL